MIFKSMAPGSAGIGNIPLDSSMKQVVIQTEDEELENSLDEDQE